MRQNPWGYTPGSRGKGDTMKDKILTDIFGVEFGVGDYILRGGGFNDMLLCKVIYIHRNQAKNIMYYRVSHPFRGKIITKKQFPSFEVIVVSEADVQRYVGNRQRWDAYYISTLMDIEVR
jgi:hypothetical protein